MKNLLELRNIYLKFNDKIIFRSLNLILNFNEIIVIKTGVLDGGTSLLKLCNHDLFPQSGAIFYEDVQGVKLNNKDLFKTVGMQFESEGLLSMYTVKENCQLPLTYHTQYQSQVIEKNILAVAQEFELVDILDKYPYQLNDVQLRLANLLRLLSSKPKIILLDEIQSGLSDSLREVLLMKIVRYIKRNNISMLMTITAGDMDDFADRKFKISNFNLTSY